MKIKMLLGLGGGLLGWRFFFIYPSLTDSNPSLVGEIDPGILVGDIEPDFWFYLMSAIGDDEFVVIIESGLTLFIIDLEE